MQPVLCPRSRTTSGILTSASSKRFFTESKTFLLVSLFFNGIASIQKQRHLPYCSSSSLSAWLSRLSLHSSDTCCWSILFWETNFSCCLDTSLFISLVISAFKSLIKGWNVHVKYCSSLDNYLLRWIFNSSNLCSIFLVIIAYNFFNIKLIFSNKLVTLIFYK